MFIEKPVVDELAIKTYPLLENMLNPTENSTSWDTSTCGNHEVTRYTFDLERGTVSSSTFENLLQGSSLARYVNQGGHRGNCFRRFCH